MRLRCSGVELDVIGVGRIEVRLVDCECGVVQFADGSRERPFAGPIRDFVALVIPSKRSETTCECNDAQPGTATGETLSTIHDSSVRLGSL